MAIFSTNTAVNFINDFSLLELVPNSDNYTTKTAALITVSDGGLLFESTIDMAGTFIHLPDMTIGTITSLTFNIQPQGFHYTITGLDLNLNDLRAAAAAGVDKALEKIFENSDTINGSEGNDSFKGYGGADFIYGVGGNDSVNGGEGDDHLFGGLGNDSLDGSAGNDSLIGNGDNDYLSGGAGNDFLDGGDGIDAASYDEKNSAVVVTLNGSADAVVLVNGVAEDTIRDIENLYGGDGNDVFTGDALANMLSGEDGDDRLNGMGGDDSLFGNDGNDMLDGAAGNDSLKGGSGNDSLNGGEGDDTLVGGTGADVMDGGAGTDTADYDGTTGDLSVILTGATGAALFINGVAEDTLLNVENIAGDSGNDSLTGDDLANVFTGNLGNDALFGMKGNDTLDGSAGTDTLSGGKGMDLLIGGADADSFVFDAKLNKKKNVDTIDDFAVADDTIHLADNIFKKLDAGALELKQFHIGNKAHDNNDRLIYNANNGKLYYDADGKKDGFDKVLVAKLDTGLAMTHEDFLVV